VFNFPGNKKHLDFISPQLELPYSRIITTTTNAGEDVVKQEQLNTAGGYAISSTTMESSEEIPQKTKNKTAI
jgi:hypothetical protein